MKTYPTGVNWKAMISHCGQERLVTGEVESAVNEEHGKS